MKILHTSDWHLGKMVYGRRCHAEFEAFLHWLTDEIERQQADYLLIAGDIFDSTTPANRTQGLYYSFLHRVSSTCCRHVVIIGGNHDSPSLLHAPRKLLKHLNVNVVGSISSVLTDEVLCLRNAQGELELIVCAVPYLRDRDVRKSEAGESIEDKAQKLVKGIADHYREIGEIALSIRESNAGHVPIIGMGHLFTAGGKIDDNNEVRDLYVGSLAHIHGTVFPECMDYIALGHLHIAQCVNKTENIRYSGSPLHLSFSKKTGAKSITAITITETIAIEQVEVPSFLNLQSIQGTFDDVYAQISGLKTLNKKVLVEIILTDDSTPMVHDELLNHVNSSKIEILRVMNQRSLPHEFTADVHQETLDSLSELEVFRKCLEIYEIPEDERKELEMSFLEIFQELQEEDER